MKEPRPISEIYKDLSELAKKEVVDPMKEGTEQKEVSQELSYSDILHLMVESKETFVINRDVTQIIRFTKDKLDAWWKEKHEAELSLLREEMDKRLIEEVGTAFNMERSFKPMTIEGNFSSGGMFDQKEYIESIKTKYNIKD
jgi:hypothetical protein